MPKPVIREIGIALGVAQQGGMHPAAKVSQPKISALKNYKLDGFSVERLMSFLLSLGRDVEIRITPRRLTRAPGRIVVQAE